MATSKLTVRIHVPIWVLWYIRCVALFSVMTGMEPDYDRVEQFVLSHMKVRHGG